MLRRNDEAMISSCTGRDPVRSIRDAQGAGAPSSSAHRGSGHVRFADGRDAGRQLAMPLGEYRYEEPVVLGMVRTRLPAAAGLRER